MFIITRARFDGVDASSFVNPENKTIVASRQHCTNINNVITLARKGIEFTLSIDSKTDFTLLVDNGVIINSNNEPDYTQTPLIPLDTPIYIMGTYTQTLPNGYEYTALQFTEAVFTTV